MGRKIAAVIAASFVFTVLSSVVTRSILFGVWVALGRDAAAFDALSPPVRFAITGVAMLAGFVVAGWVAYRIGRWGLGADAAAEAENGAAAQE